MTAIWRIAVRLPLPAAAAAAELFEEMFGTVSLFEIDDGPDRLVEAFGARPPDRSELEVRLALLAAAHGAAAPELRVERVPPTDWLAATYQAFPPIRIGRFFIHGSHHEGGVPAGAIGLRIDAATAFGSGEHPTTAGCLLALARLAPRHRVRRALDMGSGTGILAFAMARLWRRPVVAADNDAEAVRVARLNARRNGVARLVGTMLSDGYRAPAVRRGAPYDLITANILARPLVRMAPAAAAALAPGGVIVLSGLLSRQECAVLAAHRAQGLVLVGRLRIGAWSVLLMARPHRPGG